MARKRAQPSFVSVLLLALVPVTSCGGDAEEEVEAPSPEPPPPPPVIEPDTRASGARIAFASDTIDFGEVWDFEDLECRFEFTNEGDRPLVITETKPSCSCTPIELDRHRFEPGEGGVIETTWDLKGFGPQAKTIAVTSNSVGTGMKILTIRAEIRPFAEFEPRSLRLGELDLGVEHRRTVRLTCADPGFELVAVTCSNRGVDARDLGPAPGGGRSVEVILRDTLPWGTFVGRVDARVRGRLEGREGWIEHSGGLAISGTVLGDLRLEPTLLTVGRVAPGAPIRYEVVARSASGTPFEITALRVENAKPPELGVRAEPHPGGGWRIRLEGETGSYQGRIRGWVVVETDLPGEGPRRLSVMGIVRE